MSTIQKAKQRIIRELVRRHSYPRKNVVDDIVTERPFDFSPAWKKNFLEAARHNFQHHVSSSHFYRKLCRHRGFGIDNIRTFEDIWDIPFILCDVFKHYNIETDTKSLIRVDITSTGTSGRKSKVVLDAISGQRIIYSAYHIYKSLGVVSDKQAANYLMMAYNPEIDITLATTNSDVIISYFVPQKKIFYALDLNDKREVAFLKDEAVDGLHAFIKEGLPVRVLGFLHHTCEVVRAYCAKYGKVQLPPDSFILSGGGWKNFAHLYGDAFDLLSFLKENSTIDPRNVRDLYTLSEHPVFYFECSHHNMHIPNVSLACIRDPRTLKRLGYGKTGLVHLYTPLIESTPLISILTTDYGYINERCTCPIGGPYLKILGRAGVKKKMTCTLTADQYIKKADYEMART